PRGFAAWLAAGLVQFGRVDRSDRQRGRRRRGVAGSGGSEAGAMAARRVWCAGLPVQPGGAPCISGAALQAVPRGRPADVSHAPSSPGKGDPDLRAGLERLVGFPVNVGDVAVLNSDREADEPAVGPSGGAGGAAGVGVEAGLVPLAAEAGAVGGEL